MGFCVLTMGKLRCVSGEPAVSGAEQLLPSSVKEMNFPR